MPMKSKTSPSPKATRTERARADRQKELQPPPTGGNRGSPVAPVMPQFAKTRGERSGRS